LVRGALGKSLTTPAAARAMPPNSRRAAVVVVVVVVVEVVVVEASPIPVRPVMWLCLVMANDGDGVAAASWAVIDSSTAAASCGWLARKRCSSEEASVPRRAASV
jgi:hypothetical protein